MDGLLVSPSKELVGVVGPRLRLSCIGSLVMLPSVFELDIRGALDAVGAGGAGATAGAAGILGAFGLLNILPIITTVLKDLGSN